MRILLVLLLAVLALRPAPAAAQARPGSLGLRLGNDLPTPTVRFVLAGSPAALAGVRFGDRVLAVDGRPVQGMTARQVERRVEGPVGSPVQLTVSGAEGTRTLRAVRADLFAPGPGYTAAVRTEHFVVHHRADGGSRRFARRLARHAEARARRELRGVDTQGRRAHLFVVPAVFAGGEVKLRQEGLVPWWGAWVEALPGQGEHLASTLAYLRYGEPGVAASERLGGKLLWSQKAADLHRDAVWQMVSMGLAPDTPPEVLARVAPELASVSASLREYVRERWGERRFASLWRSDLPFPEAVRRELGVEERELMADWRDEVYTLGPRRDAGPGFDTFLVALGWGVVVLLAGVWVARGKEAG